MDKPNFRTAIFGIGGLDIVVCVAPPKDVEGAGLYIHVEDIEKFLEWQEQQSEPVEE